MQGGKIMKKVLAILLALVMVLALAACAAKPATDTPAKDEPQTNDQPQKEETPSETPAADEKKDDVVITFCTRQDPTGADAESAYTLEKVEEFNAMDNGIHVEIVWNSVEADYLDRLLPISLPATARTSSWNTAARVFWIT